MEKKLITSILAVLALLTALQPVHAAGATDIAYLLEISGTSFLPSTIYAGDVVSLAVDVENKGSYLSAVDVGATLEVGSQFEPIDLEESKPAIKKGTTETLIFKFRAKENTLPGYYSVLLTISYVREGTEQKITETQSISVPVSKTEKSLDVTIDPKVINPGNQTEVVFTIANIGGTPVSNISFYWEEENNLVLPVGSDNKRFVSILKANADASVSYTVAADPNIEPGIYPLNVTMTFTDVDGTRSQASQVGLIVGGKTDFEVSAEILSTGQLSVSIANVGSNNANAVVVRIPDQQGISVSGTNASILGNLNKGDFTLANFEVRATAAQGMQLPAGDMPDRVQGTGDTTGAEGSRRRSLTIEIDYTDTTGERQNVQKNIELDMVFSGTDTTSAASTTFAGRRATQSANGNSVIAWGLLAAIIIGAALFNRFKAGNQNWKELGKMLAVIVALFLAVIFLMGSNQVAIGLVAIVSAVLLAWFFEISQVTSLIGKAADFLKKPKE